MAIQTTVVGAYPKPPEEGKPFVLRSTLHAVERGEATDADVQQAIQDLTREMIAEQEAAGIDLISDGQAGWEDILTPFASTMAGFEIDGLLRWFDNNVYYRRPVAVGPLEWRGPTSVDAFAFAQSVASGPVKAVIPGPITFARMSIDEHYGDYEAFVLAIARVLAQEAFELEAAGARFLQIDEPSLPAAPEDLPLARRALQIVTSELRASETETTLATYFGDAKRLGSELFDLPVDCVALDFVAGPANLELLEGWPDDKKLQAGIVDARNTLLEPIDELARLIDELAGAAGSGNLRPSPSAPLEFLPREKARAKLQRLSEAARKAGS